MGKTVILSATATRGLYDPALGHGYEAVGERCALGDFPGRVDMPFSPELVSRLRGKMDSGAIPTERPPTMFAGHGNGGICAGCDDPILPDQVEYEMDYGHGRIYRLHLACAHCWEAESHRRGHHR